MNAERVAGTGVGLVVAAGEGEEGNQGQHEHAHADQGTVEMVPRERVGDRLADALHQVDEPRGGAHGRDPFEMFL